MFRCCFGSSKDESDELSIVRCESIENIYMACNDEKPFTTFSKNMLDDEYIEKLLNLNFNEIKKLLDELQIFYNEDDNNYINFPLDNQNLYIYSKTNIIDFTDLETRKHINKTTITKLINILNNYENETKRILLIKFINNK